MTAEPFPHDERIAVLLAERTRLRILLAKGLGIVEAVIGAGLLTNDETKKFAAEAAREIEP